MNGISDGKARALNALLRMLPLAAKLLLTLYMGRYLSLADMGVWGLVVGAVTVIKVVLGQGFDYVGDAGYRRRLAADRAA